MSIKISGIEFTGPHYMEHCTIPPGSGLYAIMIQTDSNTYSVIYVGETSDFAERITSSHHKHDCWTGFGKTLHYGLHIMPNSSPEQRRSLEKQLIDIRSPSCND